MSYEIAYETLLEIVPNKEIPRFKALLAGRKTLTLETKLQEEWTYFEGWNAVKEKTNHRWQGVASDFRDRLSENMYIYDDLVVYVEHKGIDGWFHPKVTLLSLSKGFIKFDYSKDK